MKRSDLLTIYAARALRGFGDGFAIIILPVYLSVIGLTAPQIGLVATASLLGTALLTLAVGMIAPRFELRSLLLAGAALAVITGLAFPAIESFAFVWSCPSSAASIHRAAISARWSRSNMPSSRRKPPTRSERACSRATA